MWQILSVDFCIYRYLCLICLAIGAYLACFDCGAGAERLPASGQEARTSRAAVHEGHGAAGERESGRTVGQGHPKAHGLHHRCVHLPEIFVHVVAMNIARHVVQTLNFEALRM